VAFVVMVIFPMNEEQIAFNAKMEKSRAKILFLAFPATIALMPIIFIRHALIRVITATILLILMLTKSNVDFAQMAVFLRASVFVHHVMEHFPTCKEVIVLTR